MYDRRLQLLRRPYVCTYTLVQNYVGFTVKDNVTLPCIKPDSCIVTLLRIYVSVIRVFAGRANYDNNHYFVSSNDYYRLRISNLKIIILHFTQLQNPATPKNDFLQRWQLIFMLPIPYHINFLFLS